MPFIAAIPDEAATEDTAALYEEARSSLGFVPNYVRAFGAAPAVYRAWQQLNGAIKAAGDLRRYELATLAAARRLRSSYCSLQHGKVLAEQFYDADTVRRLPAGLDEADTAIMALAEKVVDDAAAIGEADFEPLRAAGLGDDEIATVVYAAAARCFFSKALDALGYLPDASYADLDPALREAHTYARPIEKA
jgi:uncharacterized peroxidase-related enzyme